MKFKLYILAAILCIFLASGCAYAPLALKTTPGVDQAKLAKYSVLVVDEFKPAEKVKADDLVMGLADKVAYNLKTSYPGLFEEVVTAANAAKEYPGKGVMKVVGIIEAYERGSRFARAMLIGLGGSKIDLDVTLSDFVTNETLANGKVKRFYAVGGIAGASYGIEEMISATAKEVADKIYELKSGQKASKK